MYCITIKDNHYEKINKLGYLPVGLGKNISSSKFILDNTGETSQPRTHSMVSIVFTTGFGKMN